MEFEVWNKEEPDVKYNTGMVTFPAFEFYKGQAEQIAKQIKETDVTEENVKDVKKLLADARKVTIALDQRRIAIKKEILRDYNTFESQIKELTSIIDEADNDVRSKVRLMEEKEREVKENTIKELWDKRVSQYQINDYVPTAFNFWLQPSYLNKSTSMKSIEKEMVDWLEATENAINTLKGMDEEYLVEYINCLDLSTAISSVNERSKIREVVSDMSDEETASFIITGKKNIKLVEMLLNENEIEFKRK